MFWKVITIAGIILVIVSAILMTYEHDTIGWFLAMLGGYVYGVGVSYKK